MSNYNTIEIPFDLDKFETKENFDNTIGKIIGLLTDLDYVMKVWNDGYTTVIEFSLDPEEFGGPELQWCNENECIYSESDIKEIKEEIRQDLQEDIEYEPYRIWRDKVASFVEKRGVDYTSFLFNNRDKKIEDLSILEVIGLVQKERESEVQ